MKISAKNTGPIKSFDGTTHPGLNVLRGANGSGKSTLLNAVQFVLTKTGEKPTPRDGCKAGRIEVDGITATFAGRTTVNGELLVESLSGRLDIGSLVVNEYEDDSVTDKHRIRKLIELSGAQATPSAFVEILGEAADAVPPDLMDAADWAKKLLHDAARKHEADAEAWEQKKLAALQSAEGVDVTVETDQERLQAAYTEAVAEAATLKQKTKEVGDRRTAANTSRLRLEAIEASAVPIPEQQARNRYERASSDRDACRCDIQDAEQRFCTMREQERLLTIEMTNAARQIETSRQHAELVAELQANIDAGQLLLPVPQDVIDAATAAVTAAREAIERGAVARKAKEQITAANDFSASAAREAKIAAILRTNAGKTDEILASELSRIGCPWYPVDAPISGGSVRRLKVRHPRRGECFVCDLSDGERARDAIDIALGLGGRGKPAVLILQQEHFEGLQPSVREAIDRHAVEKGVEILTAASSDDDEVTL